VSETKERELERAATAGDRESLRELIASMARRGMFFVCEECGAIVPPQARDRHDYEHDYQRSLEAERERIVEANREEWEQYEKTKAELAAYPNGGGMKVVPLPPITPHAGVGCRPKNEPLWHRRWVTVAPRRKIRFFTDQDATPPQSNLHYLGSLPAASHFYAYGLSLVLDEGTSEQTARQIRNTGQVWFLLGGAVSSDPMPTKINNDLPARAVVYQRHFLASEVLVEPEKDVFSGLVPMHRLSVEGKPVEIRALECLAVDLNLPGEPIGPVGITCILHGLRLTGITG
jgi:hypothetical protein